MDRRLFLAGTGAVTVADAIGFGILGEAGAAHVLALIDKLESLPDLRNSTAALRGA
jgi:hypothetical protein